MSARVFIVEDDDIIITLIQQILTLKGYIIAGTASSGKEALEKIPKTTCDIVLMDISLKGDMDGITTARLLNNRVQVPIIFVTANFDENLLSRAKTPYTYGYIIKPFSTNDLVSNIEIALFLYRTRTELQAPKEPPKAGVAGRKPTDTPPVTEDITVKPRLHKIKDELKNLYDHGHFYMSKGNYQQALQYFLEILEQDPDDALIWVEKGEALQKLGKTDEALDAINTALRIDPGSEYAVCKKSRILCGLGKYDEALSELDSMLKLYPDTLSTLVEKGMVLHEMGKKEEALRTLDHAIKTDTKSGYALGAKGRVLGKLGRDKEALAVFGQALRIEPKNVSLWMDTVRFFEQKQNYHAALNIVQKAIEQNPANEILTLERDNLLHKTIPLQ